VERAPVDVRRERNAEESQFLDSAVQFLQCSIAAIRVHRRRRYETARRDARGFGDVVVDHLNNFFHRQLARPRRRQKQIAIVDDFLLDAEAIHQGEMLLQRAKPIVGIESPPKVTSRGKFAERVQDRRWKTMGMTINQTHNCSLQKFGSPSSRIYVTEPVW